MNKEYYLRYRIKGFMDIEWKDKSYKAKDLNELIYKINELHRKYTEFYIITIYELERKEND